MCRYTIEMTPLRCVEWIDKAEVRETTVGEHFSLVFDRFGFSPPQQPAHDMFPNNGEIIPCLPPIDVTWFCGGEMP